MFSNVGRKKHVFWAIQEAYFFDIFLKFLSIIPKNRGFLEHFSKKSVGLRPVARKVAQKYNQKGEGGRGQIRPADLEAPWGPLISIRSSVGAHNLPICGPFF